MLRHNDNAHRTFALHPQDCKGTFALLHKTPVEQTPAPPADQSRGGKVPAILGFYNSASLFRPVPSNLVREFDGCTGCN